MNKGKGKKNLFSAVCFISKYELKFCYNLGLIKESNCSSNSAVWDIKVLMIYQALV